MKLTCVTAVYNAIASGNRERLIRCVESVAKLNTEHEHLIYDGGSKDGTIELLKELGERVIGMRWRSEPDSGIYNALNKGVRDAQGEWLYVLGCDDYVAHPNVLAGLLCSAKISDQLIVAPVKVADREGGLRDDASYRRNIFWAMPYCHQGVLMRTEIARRFNGFDERCRICGDYSLILKCHLCALGIRFVKDWFAVFTRGGTSCGSNGEIGDSAIVMQKEFHITDRELQFFKGSYVLPLKRVVPYLWHRDPTLRWGALYMVARWFRYGGLRSLWMKELSNEAV